MAFTEQFGESEDDNYEWEAILGEHFDEDNDNLSQMTKTFKKTILQSFNASKENYFNKNNFSKTFLHQINLDPQTWNRTTQNQSFLCTTAEINLSSAKTSRFYLYNTTGKDGVTQGDYVHIVIETRNARDKRRNVGGDFFFGVMKNTKLKKSTSGRVIDYNNGTYSVYFYASWHGSAEILITLWYTKEAIQWIDTMYKPRERHVEWDGIFTHANKTEHSRCYVVRNEIYLNKCEYRNKNALGDTVFACDKPPTLPCESLEQARANGESVENSIKTRLRPDQEILFKSPYLTSAVGSPLTIMIKDNSKQLKKDLDDRLSCTSGFPTLMSTGFWETESRWISLACKTSHWTETTAGECLRGKTVYLLGDSTMRQWHESMTDLMDVNNISRSNLRHFWRGTEYNISLVFNFHPIMIGSKYNSFWKQKFSADVIDEIEDCNAAIVLSLTYHFCTWTKESYIERLNHVRRAIIRLQARCPDTVVMIKSSHPRDHNNWKGHIHSSDWTLFDMNRILSEIFSDIGVKYIDIWDMSLSHFHKNNVHMPLETVIRQQIDLMLSFVCPAHISSK
uniref:NXPE family member 4-like n=1 Tax=Saccoglossus kowalevskii TaxID=10224 RepID=A0ABM0MXP4_SACKO|nr:PREDICTED: NXPE family member 4-like [Saccoglossus kowalevskii]